MNCAPSVPRSQSTAQFNFTSSSTMSVYQSLFTEGKQPHCEDSNPCCEPPCDEPSFWDLLPQCRLNWIALGLAAFAIGFALIGLGYLNIGVIKPTIPCPSAKPSCRFHHPQSRHPLAHDAPLHHPLLCMVAVQEDALMTGRLLSLGH